MGFLIDNFNNETYCDDFNIVINEINYNPSLDLGQEDADYEFIELYNIKTLVLVFVIFSIVSIYFPYLVLNLLMVSNIAMEIKL